MGHFIGNIISDSAIIEMGAEVGNYNVMGAVYIGKDTVVENFCEIMSGTTIGKNCFVRSYSRIGANTKIGNNVIIKCSAIITSRIVIEDDVFIGPQAILLAEMKRVSESRIHVKKGAIIGAGARIQPGITVGENAVIGANSFVNRDVQDGEVVVGTPIRQVRIKK